MPEVKDVRWCALWAALAASCATASARVLLYGTAGDVSPLISVLCSCAAAVPAWLAVGQLDIHEEDRAVLRAILVGTVTPTLMFVGEGGGVMPSWCMAILLVLTNPANIGALLVLGLPAALGALVTWRFLTGNADDPVAAA